ncbi:GNAT family N-acetyltransferase [Streptomyces albidoflavus]|uniref:GNAT family N-acetyltransferase n=1 Tax=Streptomyces TaxID=1883 RepID=UPI001161EB1B|nr:GNAT family N-acetyltransferase [Streptomyces albidoflavus]
MAGGPDSPLCASCRVERPSGAEGTFPVGYVELRPDADRPDRTELSYGLLRKATGRGLAREAVRAVLDGTGMSEARRRS